MKRILSLLLALCVTAALLPAGVLAAESETSGTCGENVSWSFDGSTGTLTISGTGAMEDYDAIWDDYGYFIGADTPWCASGCEVTALVIEEGVTAIGEYAFATLDTLQTVQLPSTLTVIGWSAFEACASLTGIEVPEGVTEIGLWAFEDCSALTKVSLPSSLTKLGDSAFENCTSLTEINLPDSLTKIAARTFANCVSLTKLYPPESLEGIEYHAFLNSGLTEISIPDAVSDIASTAFAGCKKLEEIHVPGYNQYYWSEEGVLYSRATEEKDYQEVVRVPSAYDGVLEIPEGIKYLGDDDVYEGCTELRKIILPATVEGVTSYGNYNVFRDSADLWGIWVDEANPYLLSTEEGVLYTKDMTELITCPARYEESTFEIPDTVTKVCTYAFNNCVNLTDIYIPASVESGLGGQTFLGCHSLTGLWVDEEHPSLCSDENGVIFNKEFTEEGYTDSDGDGEPEVIDVLRPEKSILYIFPAGRYGYYEVPDGVTELAGDSFAGAQLEAIRLPESITRMSYWCMCWCENLDWILFTGDKPSFFGDGWLEDGTATVYYPMDNSTWTEDPYGLSHVSTMSFGDVTLVGYHEGEEPVWPGPTGTCGENVSWAFNNSTGTLTISGTGAMDDYYGIWEGEDYTELVGTKAPWYLRGCEVTSLVIEEGVTYIGEYAFAMLDTMETAELPEGLLEIGNAAFTGSGLTGITIPASVYNVGLYPFGDCGNLSAIWVADGNTAYCSDKQGVLYSKDMTELVRCPAAYGETTFNVPETVTRIFGGSFQGCRNLTDIYIPAGIQRIVEGAFNGCSSLTGIWVEEGNSLYCSDETGVVLNAGTADLQFEAPIEPRSKIFIFPKGRTGYYEVPENITKFGYCSFNYSQINAIRFHENFEGFDFAYTMIGCENLEWVLFTGDAPYLEGEFYLSGPATIYYPLDNPTWDESKINCLTNVGHTCIGYAEGEEPVWPGLSEHEHSFGPWTVEKEPTSTEEGLKNRTCAECGETETEAIPALENSFDDVKSSEYYYEPILWAAYHGITTGATETTFAPEDTCTRAQIVTFLWRAKGQPEPSSTENPFVDVKSSDYFYNAVLWAVENGITTGMDATHFGPNEACTRAQVATFLWRAEGEPEVSSASNPFKDIRSGDYYYSAVLWAVENSITLGTSETTFSPADPCTRGQIVTFLYRAYAKA